jgi:hypothetical protein
MGTSSLPALSPNNGPSTAVVETSANAAAAREKAAVEARFLVALHRPRNPDNARARLLARCESPRFADVAEYSKPVGGGKKAQGASIRMMEEIARQWGNVDVQAPVLFDDLERRIIRVTATDLESNYSASVDVILEKTVERRNPRDGDEVISQRTNSTGATVYRIRADEDAFLVKQNANVSKSRRECIRAIVPGDLVDEAMQTCATTRRSETKKDPAAARKRIADSFFALGVMPAQLCDLLGKQSLEALTEAEIEYLRATYAAMRDGEATWTAVVEAHQGGTAPVAAAATAPTKGTEGLKAAVGKKKADVAPAAPAAEPANEAAAPKKCEACFEVGGHLKDCPYAG